MILDARDQSIPLNRAARIVIAGAGPAGIVLARQLAAHSPVLLIESGGFDEDSQVQALQAGESVGIEYSLTQSRARRFGGASNLWAGYCAIPDAHDFSRREWIPTSGWPFGVEAIEPYYVEAARFLNVEADFDAREVAGRAATAPFDGGLLFPSVWRFSTPPLSVGDRFRHEFTVSHDITVLTHANLVDLSVERGHDTVREITIRTLNGREGRIRADFVVLACGGIETPRILLNADRRTRDRLGAASAWVGRCFMEHPHLSVHWVELCGAEWVEASAVRRTCERGGQYMLALGMSAAAQEAAGVLNARAHAFRSSVDERPRLGIMFEQAPNWESRVELSTERDELGLRRVRLDFNLTPIDRKTHRRTARILCEELERLGLCRIVEDAPEHPTLAYCNHHIGTLRMAAEPGEGAVDPDCRVHGLTNVYVAGSSVFPTSSWANPTLMLTALALRLADRLRALLCSAAYEVRPDRPA